MVETKGSTYSALLRKLKTGLGTGPEWERDEREGGEEENRLHRRRRKSHDHQGSRAVAEVQVADQETLRVIVEALEAALGE